jgi:hypothetical protein
MRNSSPLSPYNNLELLSSLNTMSLAPGVMQKVVRHVMDSKDKAPKLVNLYNETRRQIVTFRLLKTAPTDQEIQALFEFFDKFCSAITDYYRPEEDFIRLADHILYDKFSSPEHKKIPSQKTLQFITINILNMLVEAALPLAESGNEVCFQFFKRIAHAPAGTPPFLLSQECSETVKLSFSRISLLQQKSMETIPALLKSLVKKPSESPIYTKSLVNLYTYYLFIFANDYKNDTAFSELKKLSPSLEKIGGYDKLAEFYFFAGLKYDLKYWKKSKTCYIKFDEAKTDLPTKDLPVYSLTHYRLGLIHLEGIKGECPPDYHKASEYFKKVKPTSVYGEEAREILLYIEFLNAKQSIEGVVKECKEEGFLFTLMFTVCPGASGSVEFYLEKIDSWVEKLKGSVLPIPFDKISQNCWQIFLKNPEKYSSAFALSEKYRHECQQRNAVLKKSEGGETNFDSYIPLTHLMANYEKENKIVLSKPDQKLAFNNDSIIHTVVQLFQRLVHLIEVSPEFHYVLRKKISVVLKALEEIPKLYLKTNGKDQLYELFGLFISICKLGLSPENRVVYNTFYNLHTYSVMLHVHLSKQYNEGVDAFYYGVVSGFKCKVTDLQIFIDNWSELDLKHKFLLFYGLYLYHASLSTDTEISKQLVKHVDLVAHKLDQLALSSEFRDREAAMQVARAAEYFWSFGIKIKRLYGLLVNFKSMGIYPKLTPRESEMQRKAQKYLRIFFPESAIKIEYILENNPETKSTVQADTYLAEPTNILIHIDGALSHFLILDGQTLEPSRKTLGRNYICSQSGYKQVTITFEEIEAADAQPSTIIAYYKLFAEKLSKVDFSLGLEYFEPPKPKGDSQGLFTMPSLPASEYKKSISEIMISLQAKIKALPIDLPESYRIFLKQAEKAENKKALLYLLNIIQDLDPKPTLSVGVRLDKLTLAGTPATKLFV